MDKKAAKNICPLIQVACPNPDVRTVGGVLNVAESMLEECHIEARYCNQREDVLLLLAKRDALSELVGRLKWGRRNSRWARTRPSITTTLAWLVPFAALL